MRSRLLLLVLPALVALAALPGCAPGNPDALHRKVRGELALFTRWLDANNARGVVGEVGWADDFRGDADEWNALAAAWYRDADAAGLWVAAWAAGSAWGRDYPLSIYEDLQSGAGIDTANTQAGVFERHGTRNSTWRGVSVGAGEFSTAEGQDTAAFSNYNPGAYGQDYSYEPSDSYRYLASRGVKMVRIAFRWERIQKVLSGDLDPAELYRLTDAVNAAGRNGLRVVLDLHNFGSYYSGNTTQGWRHALGSSTLPESALADLWRRLSTHFKGNTTVLGYGIMNEPAGMYDGGTVSPAKLWERASQAAVNAIRSTGDVKTTLVGGYKWSGAQDWGQAHPRAWIDDPTGNTRYEAHHYWDREHWGHFDHSYADEVSYAQSLGYRP